MCSRSSCHWIFVATNTDTPTIWHNTLLFLLDASHSVFTGVPLGNSWTRQLLLYASVVADSTNSIFAKLWVSTQWEPRMIVCWSIKNKGEWSFKLNSKRMQMAAGTLFACLSNSEGWKTSRWFYTPRFEIEVTRQRNREAERNWTSIQAFIPAQQCVNMVYPNICIDVCIESRNLTFGPLQCPTGFYCLAGSTSPTQVRLPEN